MRPGPAFHREHHCTDRVGWLRAAVLGANDSLVFGVAAANASPQNIPIAASAGLVAGAFSMAAGEYVPVSSRSDAEESKTSITGKIHLHADIPAQMRISAFGWPPIRVYAFATQYLSPNTYS